MSSDLFSLGMIPTVDALEAFCDYGDLTNCSFEPYVAEMQSGVDFSFSTSDEFYLGENQTITIQQEASNKTDTAASEEEQRDLGRRKRRLRNRVAA
jgi:hypothetical protein